MVASSGFTCLPTMVAGLMVRKYVSKVDHFLVAGREMNVYLGIASLAATEFGIITCMYTAQAGYTNGFAGALARPQRSGRHVPHRHHGFLHQTAARLGRDHAAGTF
jgi:hypothetical protein